MCRGHKAFSWSTAMLLFSMMKINSVDIFYNPPFISFSMTVLPWIKILHVLNINRVFSPLQTVCIVFNPSPSREFNLMKNMTYFSLEPNCFFSVQLMSSRPAFDFSSRWLQSWCFEWTVFSVSHINTCLFCLVCFLSG